MNNQDYEIKKRECWEEFCKANPVHKNSHFARGVFVFTFDRAYTLGKQEKAAEDTVINGWVARDKSGYLVLHYKKPHRTSGNTKWYSAQSQKSLPRDFFPDLTWESDPEPVEIIIKRKKK